MLLFSCSAVSDPFVTPWTAAHQASLFMGFLRQDYWNKLPFPPSGHLPNPGIKLEFPTWQLDSLPRSHLGPPHCECFSEGQLCSSITYVHISALSLPATGPRQVIEPLGASVWGQNQMMHGDCSKQGLEGDEYSLHSWEALACSPGRS